MRLPAGSHRNRFRAFTRWELMVAFLGLGILCLLAIPTLGQGPKSRVQVCVDNLRRMTAAWYLYSADHHGVFPPKAADPGRPAWSKGWLSWNTQSDNTNLLLLTDPAHSLIAPYLQSDPRVFKCPADHFLSPAQIEAGWSQRTRTYSMNGFFGTSIPDPSTNLPSQFRVYSRLQDFRQRGPADLVVFVEEHPDSLNDPTFEVPRTMDYWRDYPGAFHDQATTLGWGDGHVTRHRWQHRSMYREVTTQWDVFHRRIEAHHPDLAWYLEVCSERLNP